MDWREKIKAAKGRPAEAPKAAAVKAQPKKYATKPDLEVFSGGLPPGWKALWDKQSGEIYYGNPTTKVGKAGRSQWALLDTDSHYGTKKKLRGEPIEIEIEGSRVASHSSEHAVHAAWADALQKHAVALR